MEYTIKINDDMINNLIEKELGDYIETLEKDLQNYKDFPGMFIAIFDIDPKKDQKEIKKTLKALKRIKALYTVGGNA